MKWFTQTMRRILVPLLTVLALATGAEAARAQACPAPKLESLYGGSSRDTITGVRHFRVGTPGEIRVSVEGASTVEIDWRDGQRQRLPVHDGFARARHLYLRPARTQIIATAFAACGATSEPGGYTVSIFPPCHRSLGRDLFAADCDEARDTMTLRAGGLHTDGTWETGPCRDTDNNYQPGPPEPVARAASCEAPLAPTPVDGYLPVWPGRRVTLVLGAPAKRVTAALRVGDDVRGRRHAAKRLGTTGRRWSVRLPARLGAADRLDVRARRARGYDAWAVGINPR